MATRLYLNNSPAFSAPSIKGAWDAVADDRVISLSPVKFGAVITTNNETESVGTAPYNVLLARGVSTRLQAQSIAGYLDVILGIGENDASAMLFWHLHAYVTVGNTDVVRGILLDNYVEDTTNEWPVFSSTGTGQGKTLQFAAPLNPVSALSGDRIVIEFGYVARNVVTTSFTGRIFYGTSAGHPPFDAADLVLNSTAVDSRAGCVDFTQDLLFEPIPEAIAHQVVQVAEDAVSPARISHLVLQVPEVTHPVTRIAHIVIQVCDGKKPAAGDISGIYFIDPLKMARHDSYYGGVEVKIPDPTIKTALFGE